MEEDYSRVSKPLLAQITVYVSDIKRLAPEWPGSAFIWQSSPCPLVTFYSNFAVKLTRPGSLFIWQLVGPFSRSAKIHRHSCRAAACGPSIILYPDTLRSSLVV